MSRRTVVVLLSMCALLGAVMAPAAAGADARVDVIVVFADGVGDSRAAAHRTARDHGVELSFVYEHALEGFAGSVPEGRLNGLRNDRRVAYVEMDGEVTIAAQQAPTGLRRIFATDNTAIPTDGTGGMVDVDIAIIDTGIASHPDLNLYRHVDCFNHDGGPPFARTYHCEDGGTDGNGHGTHVAGTAAALDNDLGVVGVAPGARLWGVRVLDNNGSGSWSTVIAGVDYVTANASHIEVANMSLGGSCCNQALDDAIAKSVAAGVTYAVAAGNSNTDAATATPANHPDVVTVAALADFDGLPGGFGAPTCRSDEDDTRANFSNYGSVVDIFAPGVCIRSTVPGGYATYSGTSMASPHVAGAAALLASQGHNDAQIKATLALTANQDWDTTTAPAGTTHDLLDVGSTAFAPVLVDGSGGGGGTEPEPEPEPAPAPDGVHVSSLSGSAVNQGGNWLANVTVTIHDGASPAAGVTVVFDYVSQRNVTGTVSCETGADGTCTPANGVSLPKRDSWVTFTVRDLLDANGQTASITVNKP